MIECWNPRTRDIKMLLEYKSVMLKCSKKLNKRVFVIHSQSEFKKFAESSCVITNAIILKLIYG